MGPIPRNSMITDGKTRYKLINDVYYPSWGKNVLIESTNKSNNLLVLLEDVHGLVLPEK